MEEKKDDEGGFAAADCKCVNASLVCIVHAVQLRRTQEDRGEETPHAVRIRQQRSSTGASVVDLKVLVIQYLLSIFSHLLLCPYIFA